MELKMPIGPEYRGRSPEEIISEKIDFDSVGYIYRALSWLDVAKRSNYNICALQYAAHDTRQAIEQLFLRRLFSAWEQTLIEKIMKSAKEIAQNCTR